MGGLYLFFSLLFTIKSRTFFMKAMEYQLLFLKWLFQLISISGCLSFQIIVFLYIILISLEIRHLDFVSFSFMWFFPWGFTYKSFSKASCSALAFSRFRLGLAVNAVCMALFSIICNFFSFLINLSFDRFGGAFIVGISNSFVPF